MSAAADRLLRRQLDRVAIDFSTRKIYFDVPANAIDTGARHRDNLGSRLD